jgi:hypothetical protein
MTLEEKRQWDELYQYVKKEIMQYDKNQSLPNSIVLRLKGLTTGKLMENRSQENKANYTYEIVLYTFKICKQSILNAIATKEFNSEMSKFIYIAAIIENNINDVYTRVSNAKKSKSKTESINVDNINYNGANYQKKTEENTASKKLENLW